MQAENFLLNDCGKRQVVEEICEVFPNVSVSVLPQAFIVETVDLGDLTGLVISTEYGDSILVADLKTHQESDSLDGVVPTINIISHEKVVRVLGFSTYHK
jgi:hypothetical protein